MNYAEKISNHYAHGDLLTAIEAGIEARGIKARNASVDDLGPVDEFHIGGRIASAHFLDQIGIKPSDTILDIGCGLGGSARFAAEVYGAKVAGIDLTVEYIETGRTLCDWVGLSERIELHHGSALSMPFETSSFDAAFMMHVGMNVQDKLALAAEVSRILKPGAKFGIYDIMKMNDEELVYPVPWATTSDTSWVVSPESYREALEEIGFFVTKETNRHEFALEFFRKMREATEAAASPAPLGLHVLMQQSSAEKIQNMVANLAANRIAPVEIIAVKSD